MDKFNISIESLWKNEFLRNTGKLASGTAIAQILDITFIPILSRTYSQKAFCLLAAFFAVVGFISSYATRKYDTALILPKEDKVAYAILKLSISKHL